MVLRRKRHWVMAGFAILASLALVVGCTPTATPTTTATPTLTTTTATPTPTQVAGYPNADLLVETSWLGQHLGDAGIRIVDVRTVADYKAGHIQGAVSLPVEDTFDPAEPKMSDVGPVAQLEKVFGDRGISSDTRVIIYDGGKETKGGRLFWTLEYAGHYKAGYLNGGFKKWQKEGLPVATEETKVAAAKFTVKLKAVTLATRRCTVSAETGNVSGYADRRYKGDDLRAKRRTHTGNDVWIGSQFTSAMRRYWPAAELRDVRRPGVTRDKTAYVY